MLSTKLITSKISAKERLKIRQAEIKDALDSIKVYEKEKKEGKLKILTSLYNLIK